MAFIEAAAAASAAAPEMALVKNAGRAPRSLWMIRKRAQREYLRNNANHFNAQTPYESSSCATYLGMEGVVGVGGGGRRDDDAGRCAVDDSDDDEADDESMDAVDDDECNRLAEDAEPAIDAL